MKQVAATFVASWGNGKEVEVQLELTPRNWSKLLRGKGLSIRGKGYGYEGDFFWDYWQFVGGLDDRLEVCFGSKNDGTSGVVFGVVAWTALANTETVKVPSPPATAEQAFVERAEVPARPADASQKTAKPEPLINERMNRLRVERLKPFQSEILTYLEMWSTSLSAGGGLYIVNRPHWVLGDLRIYLENYVLQNGCLPGPDQTARLKDKGDWYLEFNAASELAKNEG